MSQEKNNPEEHELLKNEVNNELEKFIKSEDFIKLMIDSSEMIDNYSIETNHVNTLKTCNIEESYINRFRVYDDNLDYGYFYENEYYENAEDLIVKGIFGFCGCGRPQDFIYALYKELERIKNNTNNCTSDEFYDRFNDNDKEKYGLYMLIWYELDKYGFTEHGGSVPGWITSSGRELLKDLTKIIDKEDEND